MWERWLILQITILKLILGVGNHKENRIHMFLWYCQNPKISDYKLFYEKKKNLNAWRWQKSSISSFVDKIKKFNEEIAIDKFKIVIMSKWQKELVDPHFSRAPSLGRWDSLLLGEIFWKSRSRHLFYFKRENKIKKKSLKKWLHSFFGKTCLQKTRGLDYLLGRYL